MDHACSSTTAIGMDQFDHQSDVISKEKQEINNKIIEGPYLVWEDMTVVVAPNQRSNNKARKLLNDLTGYAQPNRIMALWVLLAQESPPYLMRLLVILLLSFQILYIHI